MFPKYCLGCGSEGGYVCADCRIGLSTSYRTGCFGCKAISTDGRLCTGCRPQFAFDGVIIASDYEQPLVASLIKACKYRFVREAADELAGLMIKRLEQELTGKGIGENLFKSALIAVPLSKRRLRWRGFNQAGLVARRLGEYFSLPLSDVLYRQRHRPPQATLDEASRMTNLAGTFSVREAPGQRIILIDDVITTGSTLNECATVLKAAGATEVWAVVAAKG